MSAPPAVPIDTDEFACLERSFAENVAAVFSLPNKEVLSTPYFKVANPRAPYIFFNSCMLFDGDAASADGLDPKSELSRVINHLASSTTLGFAFVVTPLSSPRDGQLEELLTSEHHLVLYRRPPVMAIKLADLATRIPPIPSGYDIVEVMDECSLRSFATALYAGFGVTPDDKAAKSVEFFCNEVGISHYPALRHFYARTHEAGSAAVATVSVWNHAGVIGIYFVATVPSHRGKGLASALVCRAALAGTASSGVAVLQSTPQGVSVYRKLGFLVASGYRVYVPESFIAPAGGVAAASGATSTEQRLEQT